MWISYRNSACTLIWILINTSMLIAGIDYSLCGPCVCVFNGTLFSFKHCTFYYLTDIKKYTDIQVQNIFGERFLDYNTDMERYETIADWAMEILVGVEQIALEGYSFNSTGRVFNIAENTGVLKYKIYQAGTPLTIFPPQEIKKYATGKGNADKEVMYKSFLLETGFPVKDVIAPDKKNVCSPVSDIIDSYFICKKLYDNIIY